MATKTAYPFRVEPQEVDFSLRITLVALGGNILNIAGIDAHTKGFGVDALNKDNFAHRLRVRLPSRGVREVRDCDVDQRLRPDALDA